MALHDVKRDAVLDALDEYEDLGVEQFLERYGLSAQTDVILEYTGRRYDGRALLGAAHRYQHGTPLTAAELENREGDIAAALARLKFHVVTTAKVAKAAAPARARSATPRRPSASAGRSSKSAAAAAPTPGKRMPVPDWTVEPGEFVVRRDIARVHGDSMTKHIEATGRTPNVLVFADPHRDGSRDGWNAERTAYFVTGEGKRGDHSWSAGNDALRTHREAGRVVRLFEPEQTWRPGGQRHCYLGDFRLDEAEPFRHDIGPDSQGQDRRIIVFKLVPGEQVIDLPEDGTADGDADEPAPPVAVSEPSPSTPQA